MRSEGQSRRRSALGPRQSPVDFPIGFASLPPLRIVFCTRDVGDCATCVPAGVACRRSRPGRMPGSRVRLRGLSPWDTWNCIQVIHIDTRGRLVIIPTRGKIGNSGKSGGRCGLRNPCRDGGSVAGRTWGLFSRKAYHGGYGACGVSAGAARRSRFRKPHHISRERGGSQL